MRTCTEAPPEPFTWARYAYYLDLALAGGYSFSTFELAHASAPSTAAERFVLLRHDIDYDVKAVLPIAMLEQERGIRATYFFQTRCLFYRLDARANDATVRHVLASGHALGLHFDATQIASDEAVLDEVERSANWLEERFQTTIAAVSFHMPTHRPVKHLTLKHGRLNTYSPLFFEKIAYVSDSNQDWRGKDLADVLTRQRPHALQLLTHPIWWRRTYRPLLVVLQELAARLHLDLETDILTPEQRALLAQGHRSSPATAALKG